MFITIRRRAFTKEFMSKAASLVINQSYSLTEASRQSAGNQSIATKLCGQDEIIGRFKVRRLESIRKN